MVTRERPDVFISATSADLGTARQAVKEALLTLGCHPIEQTNFPPDYRTIREVLIDTIKPCDAMIHIAGVVYGFEPKSCALGEPRRSYTQMEYDVAVELGKPVYVFITGADYDFGDLAEEDSEKVQLQETHRRGLMNSDEIRYTVNSQVELEQRVRELQEHLDKLRRTLKRDRRHFLWVAAGILLVMILIGWMVFESSYQVKDQSRKLERIFSKEESKPAHDYVTDHDGAGAPLFPEPDFSQYVSRVFNPPGGRLLNGTPVMIHERKEVKNGVPWIEIEVLEGPDKGKQGWTIASNVRRVH